jgi:hypothetical protein
VRERIRPVRSSPCAILRDQAYRAISRNILDNRATLGCQNFGQAKPLEYRDSPRHYAVNNSVEKEEFMSNAIILDLPDELYSALEERAARNNRSIEAEIIDILETVVLHKNA